MSAGYAAAAAALRKLGDRMATLADNNAMAGVPDPYITISVLPGNHGAHHTNALLVDAVAQALIGQAGAVSYRVGADVRYKAEGAIGPVRVDIHTLIPDPEQEDLRAEVERLRQELAAAGIPLHTADDDDPTDRSGDAVAGRSVDAVPGCTRCRAIPATPGVCCSSHRQRLCHGCYRRTHYVELCVPGCAACAREGLDPGAAVTR